MQASLSNDLFLSENVSPFFMASSPFCSLWLAAGVALFTGAVLLGVVVPEGLTLASKLRLWGYLSRPNPHQHNDCSNAVVHKGCTCALYEGRDICIQNFPVYSTKTADFLSFHAQIGVGMTACTRN
jgi:hypothetical protein